VTPEFVRVTVAQNQAEAEFVEGLLLAEGVPSLVRRAGGADVPDFLAAGARGRAAAPSEGPVGAGRPPVAD